MTRQVQHAHGKGAAEELRSLLMASATPSTLPGPLAFAPTWYNESDARFVRAVDEALHLKADLCDRLQYASVAFVRVRYLRSLAASGAPLPPRSAVPAEELHVGAPPSFVNVFPVVFAWQSRHQCVARASSPAVCIGRR